MKRLERLTALLSLLQSKSYTKIQEIEARFNISERTAYRDIKALDEAGVPISFEADRGYFIVGGHFLAPMSFTVDEAKAMLFVEQLAKRYTDKEVFGNFTSALEKIKNELKNYQLADVESLGANIKAYVNEDYTPKYLHLAQQACSEKRVLKLTYTGWNKKTTTREVEPIGITFYSQKWHLIAYCRLRNDYRDFAFPSINAIALTHEQMQQERLTLAQYIEKLEKEQTD